MIVPPPMIFKKLNSRKPIGEAYMHRQHFEVVPSPTKLVSLFLPNSACFASMVASLARIGF